MRPLWLERWMFVALCLWGIGVQTTEGVAAAGLLACGLAVAVDLYRAHVGMGRIAKALGPLLLFLGWGLVIESALGHRPTGTGTARALDWLGLPAGAWAIRAMSVERRKRLLWMVGGVFLASCAAAALQSYGLWPSAKHFESLRALKIPFDRVYEPVANSHGRFMGGGLLFHRLKFAEATSLGTLFALAFALRTRRVGLGVFAIVGLVSVALFPFARAALVALGLACAGLWVLSAKRRTHAALGALALLVAGSAAVLAIRPVRARFETSLTDEGNGYRDELVESGLRAVKANPLTGVGLGRFRPSLFAPPGTSEHVLDLNAKSHNQFVTVAAESGLVGLALFLFGIGYVARRQDVRTPEGLAGLAALAFFLLLSLLHDPLFHATFSMGLVLLLAAGEAAVRTREERSFVRPEPAPLPGRGSAPTSGSSEPDGPSDTPVARSRGNDC